MGNRLYVGNLSYRTSEDTLRSLFNANGRTVLEVKLPSDRETGQSRGFGFVELETPSQARQAIDELNDREVDGRRVVVREAEDRKSGPGHPSRGRR